MASERSISRDEVVRIMHRAGFSPARIDEITASLPEVIDLKTHEAQLASFGLTRSLLMDMFGSSP